MAGLAMMVFFGLGEVISKVSEVKSMLGSSQVVSVSCQEEVE